MYKSSLARIEYKITLNRERSLTVTAFVVSTFTNKVYTTAIIISYSNSWNHLGVSCLFCGDHYFCPDVHWTVRYMLLTLKAWKQQWCWAWRKNI